MRSFWRWLFRGPLDRDRVRVSLEMKTEQFVRLDRLARRHAVPGDLLVGVAVDRWLDLMEEKMLEHPPFPRAK